ncbi:UNVERIFIED_ORG: hypothetical protein J2W85_005951 [Ensifer adhaerens]|nr:hypothetical protein [Ensifer adhaerens]
MFAIIDATKDCQSLSFAAILGLSIADGDKRSLSNNVARDDTIRTAKRLLWLTDTEFQRPATSTSPAGQQGD